MDVKKFLRKFRVFDFITVALLLSLGYIIEYLPLKSQTYPWATSFIDQKEKLTVFSYSYLCMFTYGIGTVLVILITSLFQNYNHLPQNIAAYLFSIAFTCFITSIIKKIVQRPMPDTLDVCSVASVEVCSTFLSGHDLIMQFTSFPCRSASESAAAGVFLSLYMIDSWKSDSMYSALFKTIPIIWALIMGSFEIVCRRAYPDDSIAGLLLGSLIAYYTYRNLLMQGILSPGRREKESSSIIPKFMYL